MPCKMNQREGREKKWDGNFSPEWNDEKKHCKLLGRDGKIGSNLRKRTGSGPTIVGLTHLSRDSLLPH